jgi:FixJ family two-component response regulator
MHFHDSMIALISVERECGILQVTSLNSSTIAVVDDDSRVLESLDNLLQSYGYAVRVYGSPLDFLNAEILFDIDCLISDVGMPGMDGFALQFRVGKDRPQLPVILITGRHDLPDTGVVAANNRGVLHKPYSSSALLEAVAAALPQPH